MRKPQAMMAWKKCFGKRTFSGENALSAGNCCCAGDTTAAGDGGSGGGWGSVGEKIAKRRLVAADRAG